MNGVAVIDRVTIDCIFSGMAGFPGAGEELYTDRFSMTLGGGACVTPVRLGNMGVPVRYGTFLGQGLLSKTAETLLQKYKVQNLHNFYDGDGEPVIFSSVFSFVSYSVSQPIQHKQRHCARCTRLHMRRVNPPSLPIPPSPPYHSMKPRGSLELPQFLTRSLVDRPLSLTSQRACVCSHSPPLPSLALLLPLSTHDLAQA